MTPLNVLVVGCGEKQSLDDYQFTLTGGAKADDVRLTTLDMNPGVTPDLVCTLGREPIALPDDSVHLIVALHVLEHVGAPGDADSWFGMWEEFYRVLKPGGAVQFECPYYSSLWAWADPTHVRAISEYTFLYLNQDAYRESGSAIPRFRVKADFAWASDEDGKPRYSLIPDYANTDVMAREPVSHIRGMLAVRKPFKGWWEN